ncbi:MAG: acyltransferase family protein [Roseimicrobium sp.]
MKSAATESMDKSSELFIDALRGVAALMVLVAHGIMVALRGIYGSDVAAVPEGWHLLLSTLGFGGFWVWAFFVISGLCIQQSVARSAQRGDFTWGGYLVARVTRIYPLFLLGLALAVLGWWLTDVFTHKVTSFPWASFWGSLVMLQLFTNPFPSFAPSWSLTNEAIYYLVWPIGFVLAGGSSRRAVVGLMLGTLGLTAVLAWCWKTMHGGSDDSLFIPCWGVSAQFVIWLSGAWLGATWARLSAWVSFRCWLLAWCWLAVVWVLVAGLQYTASRAAWFMAASYLAIPGFVVLLAGSRHARLGTKETVQRLCVWLGLLSYPCYILHKPIMWVTDVLLATTLPGDLAAQPALRIALVIAVPLILLVIAGPPLERAVMAWRKRMLSPRPTLSAPLRKSA